MTTTRAGRGERMSSSSFFAKSESTAASLALEMLTASWSGRSPRVLRTERVWETSDMAWGR
ncbi:unnamed protein product [Prunus armeniaca]|uniref:Uncharacterized protein n=1 Tax=Prunus armeniaca TaxID=36596 RepID=A0A6J5XQT6_PRUAR|nr:unnamed protein product [Prunus armeniaca]